MKTTTGRMKWVPVRYGVWESACGRFEVGGTLRAKGGRCDYVRLLDRQTGKEYPCCTPASAKAMARDLAS